MEQREQYQACLNIAESRQRKTVVKARKSQKEFSGRFAQN